MSRFKEQVAKDIDAVFMNEEEFADYSDVDGKNMLVIVDTNELVDREKRYLGRRNLYGDGIYLKQLLVYVKAKDFGPLPAIGRVLSINRKKYVVIDAINEDGLYSLSLEANKSA